MEWPVPFDDPDPDPARNRWRRKVTGLQQGGVYKVTLRTAQEVPLSEVNLVLPLAGQDYKMVVAADIGACDSFVPECLEYHGGIPPVDQLDYYFWNGYNGDYQGRPDVHKDNLSIQSRTTWEHNPVSDETGMGAVGTWFGVPCRVSNASNFLVAYALRKLGYSRTDIYVFFGPFTGTPDDDAAKAAKRAGMDVAEGEIYWTIVEEELRESFAGAGDKERALWPNTANCENHVSRESLEAMFYNWYFSSPGFLFLY